LCNLSPRPAGIRVHFEVFEVRAHDPHDSIFMFKSLYTSSHRP
jgi:hypothetical protein